MTCRPAPIAALLLSLAGSPLPLLGDLAPEPLRQGLTISPTGQGQSRVEMAAEEVTLTLSPDRLQVEAVFHMRNPSDTDVTLQVGFPIGYYQDALRDFVVSRDGKRPDMAVVDRRTRETVPGLPHKAVHDYWVVWDAIYPAGQTVTETVRYWTPADWWAGYILHTGAGWAGKIGKAEVTLRLDGGLTPGHLRNFRPKGFRLSAGAEGAPPGSFATWTFEDLEPTGKDDIGIGFDPKHTLAEMLRDPCYSNHSALQGLLLNAKPLGIVSAADYWREAARTLDLMHTSRECLKDDGWLCFELLHQAVSERADPEAADLLPRLRDLARAWSEGRFQVDRKPLPLPRGTDRARLKADLEAADRILSGRQGP